MINYLSCWPEQLGQSQRDAFSELLSVIVVSQRRCGGSFSIDDVSFFFEQRFDDKILGIVYPLLRFYAFPKEDEVSVFLACRSLLASLMHDTYFLRASFSVQDKRVLHRFVRTIGALKNVCLIPLLANASSSKDKTPILLVGQSSEEEEGKILVNSEIEGIFNILNPSVSYFPVPIFECTVDIFERIVTCFSFRAKHFSGHGFSKGKLQFTTSNLYSQKMNAILAKAPVLPFLFLFFNSCYSEALVKGLNHSLFSCAFDYPYSLASSVAEQSSYDFYLTFVRTDNLYSSFQAIAKNDYLMN